MEIRGILHRVLLGILVMAVMSCAGNQHDRHRPDRVNQQAPRRVSDSPEQQINFPIHPTPAADKFTADNRKSSVTATESGKSSEEISVSDCPEETESGSSKLNEVRLSVTMNDCIERHIRFYTGKRRRHLEMGYEKGSRFFPMVCKKLLERGMPQEILWIPIVESKYTIHARSRSNAVGIWQLIPATGKKFGLRIDEWTDERYDPELATDAALDALEYLHGKMKCWLLSFAAYNAGEGRVFKAIRELNSRDFWVLRKKKGLPPQTRFYVSAILAIDHISRNPKQYEFKEISYDSYDSSTIVHLDRQSDLTILADCAGMTPSQLKLLNPALKRGWTPPDYPGFPLRIPGSCRETFLAKYLSLPEKECIRWERHKIQYGETLARIARKYNSTVEQIMQSNHLTGTLIHTGKTLMIPVGILSTGY